MRRTIVAALAALLAIAAPALGRPFPGEKIEFKKTILDREFRSEGVAVADVNRDGKADVLAGAFWYEAPDWKPHEVAPPTRFDAEKGYSDSFINAAEDVNGDGWPDLMVVGFPGSEVCWYENPGNAAGHWKKRTLFRSGCNETPLYTDLLGDGKKRWVFAYRPEGVMAWYEPSKDLETPFTAHAVSVAGAPGTAQFSHGLGVGDVNGDGRRDVLVREGWWEAPEDRTSSGWKFHPAPLGPDCADMVVLDADGDGVPDVVTSSAHGKGIWWFQQVPGPGGSEWRQELIDDSYIETHAMKMADINGDGLPDLVTGKRFWAHNGGDPGEKETKGYVPICWYELRREAGKPSWIRHLADDGNGIGTQFLVIDVNGDGLLDIVTSNKKGVAYLEQTRR